MGSQLYADNAQSGRHSERSPPSRTRSAKSDRDQRFSKAYQHSDLPESLLSHAVGDIRRFKKPNLDINLGYAKFRRRIFLSTATRMLICRSPSHGKQVFFFFWPAPVSPSISATRRLAWHEPVLQRPTRALVSRLLAGLSTSRITTARNSQSRISKANTVWYISGSRTAQISAPRSWIRWRA